MSRHTLPLGGSRSRPRRDRRRRRGRAARLLLLAALVPTSEAGCGDAEGEGRPAMDVIPIQTQGLALLEENRLDEAEAAFRQVVDLEPAWPMAHASLGRVHLAMDRLDEAKKAVERAVSLDARDPEHRLLLARILELSGDTDGARRHLETGLEAAPDHRRTLYALARHGAESGEPDGWDRARANLTRLAELESGNVVVRLDLADVAGGTGVVFAHFDDDAALDLVVARADGPPALLLDRRHDGFEDVGGRTALAAAGPATAVAAGDYDNDGLVDLFLAGVDPADRRLYRNVGDGRFEVDERPAELYRALADLRITDVLFVDYDNDGWLDLLVAGEPAEAGGRGMRLFRHAGPGEWTDASSSLPRLDAASRVAAFDFSGDGDLDLLVTLPDGSVRLLRNDGGNANHSLKPRLTGLATGVGKNNHFGIGSKVEVWAGGLYQVRHVTDPVTVIGLGEHPQAEMLRITWTTRPRPSTGCSWRGTIPGKPRRF